jgi:hypothetical protein
MPSYRGAPPPSVLWAQQVDGALVGVIEWTLSGQTHIETICDWSSTRIWRTLW